MGLLVTMTAAPKEDLSLVDETLAGNQLSFQLLVERYQDRMFALVRHYTRNAVEVEDIVQDTFLKAYSRLSGFQRQASFYTWLCRIAINTALDTLKRLGRSPVRAMGEAELDAAADSFAFGAAAAGDPRQVPAPDARMEREEVARITREVLAELPEIFRTVLVLREFEDLSYQEMADVLGISIGTVESRLFRARARFREKLAQLHPEFAEGA